jgi:phosphoribosylformylglycinamidine cyclo-ligase
VAKKLDYQESVNYSQADPMKVLAQKEGLKTANNMPKGFSEVMGTRGESAYVFKMNDSWGALVQEGLGTKSTIAKDIYEKSGVSHFASIAQDTVACIINDLVSVGATPVVLNAYWSSDSYEWLTDEKLAEDFIVGWRKACDSASVTWGGGETQALSSIVQPGALEFAGSAFGSIAEEKHIVKGSSLKDGDVIVLIEASGPHANGISLIRTIASQLSDGYETKLENGETLGQAVLKPTPLYAKLVMELQKANVDIHYLSNITGHGWRKIMRADQEFTYVMHTIPAVQEVFSFIAEQSENDLTEMYGNYNMGAGYAIYTDTLSAEKVLEIAGKLGFNAIESGTVKKGPKRVVIEPLNIIFEGESLEVR